MIFLRINFQRSRSKKEDGGDVALLTVSILSKTGHQVLGQDVALLAMSTFSKTGHEVLESACSSEALDTTSSVSESSLDVNLRSTDVVSVVDVASVLMHIHIGRGVLFSMLIVGGSH